MNKYRFHLHGLDCANCATKIENELNKSKELENCTVNFGASSVVVESKLEEEKVREVITKVLRRVEPDATLEEPKKVDFKIIRIAISSVLFGLGFLLPNSLWIYLISYFIIGYDILYKSIKNILEGELFDEFFLMTIATIGAFAIGEYPEGVAVMLFFQIGEYVQEKAVMKSRKSITSLLDLKGEYANLVVGNVTHKVEPGVVKKGEEIICKPGERIPLDGEIVDGKSTIDTSALTGESVPRSVSVGDTVLNGTINLTGAIKVKVTKIEKETVASKILEMIENASEKKTKTERFITRFARIYTPIVVFLGIFICVIPTLIFRQPFDIWFYRALTFLVVSCPCALVISVSLGFFLGIGSASKKGILIKGSDALELLNKIEHIYFDKTGTITEGKFAVSTIITIDEIGKDKLLEYAAACEHYSNHPIALSILERAKTKIDEKDLKNYKEHAGRGITVTYQKYKLAVGNYQFMQELKIEVPKVNVASTIVYVTKNKEYLGYVIIEDKIKENAKDMIETLKQNGIKKIGILSGDNKRIVTDVAKGLGIKEYYGELLPDGKAEIVSRSSEEAPTMFVGDGLNDALVLTSSDLGVSMGGIGSDAAIEASDIVLMNDDVSKITDAFLIAKKTKQVIIANIVFALTVKICVLLLSVFGFTTIWLAVFADVGVTLITILNTLYISHSN